MGGNGSGDWIRCDSKDTVESSLELAMKKFRGRIYSGSSGQITWTRGDGHQSSIGYHVILNESPTMTLSYRQNDKEDIKIPVRLQSTPMQFTGIRWWFTCPLVVNGVSCNRRVGSLFLPARGRYFGCRHCHQLTYQSCQEAHSLERLQDRLQSGKFKGNYKPSLG